MSRIERALDRAARFLDDVVLLPEPVRARLEAAEAALTRGELTAAVTAFEDVLALRPALGRAQLGLARAHLAQGALDAAEAALAPLRRRAPDDPDAALLEGELALARGAYARAALAAREAARRLARDGGAPFAAACALRARAERARGRPDRAMRELRKALAASPEDPALALALVECALDAGEATTARRLARTLGPRALAAADDLRLGLVLLRAGAAAEARPRLERAAARGDAQATLALATHAAEDDSTLGEAESLARAALARGAGTPALALLATLFERRGGLAEATDAWLAASAGSGGEPGALLRAADAVPLEDAPQLVRVADALEQALGPHPMGRALRAHALLARGEADAADALVPSVGDDEGADAAPRAWLARARIAQARGRALDTLAALDALEGCADAAERSTRDRDTVRALRRAAWLARTRASNGELDLGAALEGVAELAAARGLEGVEAGARALEHELDRPLLLAILGEFNAGKSTLVNAVLGAPIAPTGVLPTTATLHLLRGGAERTVRLVRRDGTSREGDHGALRALLEAARTEGEPLDHVEITLPSPALERVWILDTPGSNAPDTSHARHAAEALRRADAALWVFDAAQAGKATEGVVLAALRARRCEVVPVLNKLDRLRPGEREAVERALADAMPELGRAPIALSARAALAARLAGDADALRESGFPALEDALDREIFARAHLLKRRATAGRLLTLLDTAARSEREAARALDAEADRHDAAALRLRAALPALEGLAREAALAVERGAERASEDAAREVLAFVRPREHRFATHGADAEDQSFLAESLVARVEDAIDAAAEAMGEAVERALTEAWRGTSSDNASSASAGLKDADARALRLEVRAALAAPFAAFAGHQEGLVAGGALRRFFHEVLPRAALEEAPLARALGEALAPARAVLAQPLAEALEGLVSSLEARARAEAVRLRQERAHAGARVGEPIRALHAALQEVLDRPSSESGAPADAPEPARAVATTPPSD